MMSEMYKDTEIEPKLTPLSGEELQGRTSNNSNKVRADIGNWCFWEQGQQFFYDIKVFDPNAYCHHNKSLKQCHVMNKLEKKQAFNERILRVDHGIFTPLMFSINGNMGRQCQNFYSCLAQLISEKRDFLQSNFK